MKRLIILTGLLATTIIASAQTEVVTGVMRGKDYGVTYAPLSSSMGTPFLL